MTFREHTNSVNCARLSPDSQWISSGGDDGNIYIFDVRTGKVIHQFDEPGKKITSILFNPKTYTLTAGCEGRGILYYDLERFEIINSMTFNTSRIKNIEFYNKEDFEIVEWGFYASDDYIRMIH